MKTYHACILAVIASILLLYNISKKSKTAKKIFITTVFITNLIYICTRLTSIPINCGIPSFIIGLLLFLSETTGLFAFSIYVFIFTGKKQIPKKSISDLNGQTPTVDILICTYNEDIKLLSKTIISAQKLQYPKEKLKIYVLDDGNRAELKQQCKKFKVNYITRPNNTGAKAGNINNALPQITGELFAVLDADMVCKPNFLTETVRIF